jgi:hypothetical protein
MGRMPKKAAKLCVFSYVSVSADGSCWLDLEQKGLNSKKGPSSFLPHPFGSTTKNSAALK